MVRELRGSQREYYSQMLVVTLLVVSSSLTYARMHCIGHVMKVFAILMDDI
jgi:hypothetical protein